MNIRNLARVIVYDKDSQKILLIGFSVAEMLATKFSGVTVATDMW